MTTKANCKVTVSIPYYRCKPYIRRAVESILSQSHSNLTLVVVNDGDKKPPWEELAHIDDPRLIRFDLNSNRGRYFVDAIVLEATKDNYFMIQDADDWSEPNRIATLLRHMRAEHACGAISTQIDHYFENDHQKKIIAKTHDLRMPLDTRFKLRLRHHGLFSSKALLAIGGYYGGFRFAYDMLVINLLLMTTRLVFVEKALYHRTVRPDSLSVSHMTGMHSETRRKVTIQLEHIYADAMKAYNNYLSGEFSHDELCNSIRQLCCRNVTKNDRAALLAESQRLQTQISKIESMFFASSIQVQKESWRSVIEDPRLTWTGWAIDKSVAYKLQEYLERNRPKRLLELGSGMSTVLLADYASRHQAKLTSLSHESVYHQKTSELLQEFDLRKHVDLRLAPLQLFQCPGGRCYPWYATALEGQFDFVFIDGPPLKHGRQGTFFAVAPHLAKCWEIWLHDAARQHEKECVNLWSRHFLFNQTLSYPEPRGLMKLSSRQAMAETINRPSVLGISLLAGGRFNLLLRTVSALQENCPGLLENNFVVALVNGDDPRSRAYLNKLSFVDCFLTYDRGVLPIGDSTSRLMQIMIEEGVDKILHIEDDWEIRTNSAEWLQHAYNILETQTEVGQIRLRHISERVLPYHIVTRKRLVWKRNNGVMYSASAHFTFNPSLFRASDAREIFPCRSEYEAQVNFLRLGAASVQLLPGVFHHIGANQSRRSKSNN